MIYIQLTKEEVLNCPPSSPISRGFDPACPLNVRASLMHQCFTGTTNGFGDQWSWQTVVDDVDVAVLVSKSTSSVKVRSTTEADLFSILVCGEKNIMEVKVEVGKELK